MRVLATYLLFFAVLTSFSQTASGLRRAKRYATTNDYYQASQQYQGVLKADSNNYKANMEYGLLQLEYLNSPGDAGKYLLKAEKASKKDTAVEIVYGLAQYYQYQYDYDKAISYYNRTLKNVDNTEDGTFLRSEINKDIENCNYAKENADALNRKRYKISNIGSGVNTLYPEYVPIVNKDQTVMMFTSRRKLSKRSEVDETDNEYYEDMYIARKDKEGNFSDAHPFSPNDAEVKDVKNTRADHESVISLSYDGSKFYTYRNNKIYESDLKNNTWSEPKEMDASIDGDVFQNHLCISKDGKTIYFSSERAGGMGGLDIYKTEMQADGKWGPAISLGPMVNTAEDDGSPQISEDGKTLYFSSKGHKGFGGYDIFKSKWDGSMWSTPENMGIPFNSPGSDIYMIIDSSETHGYLSSSRAGGYGDMDIYEISYERKAFDDFGDESKNIISFSCPDTVYVNQPIVLNASVKGINPNVYPSFNWAINDSVLASHDKSTSYVFAGEGTYVVKLEASANSKDFTGYEKKVVVVNKPPMLATNTFGLEPVYFAFNKFNLDEDARQALDKNIKTLNEHPGTIIEIAAFCDSRGSAAYNQALSEKRAKSVIRALRKKGFDIKRVKQVDWFGEKDPVNNCTDDVPCTEDQYKLNRRAEFRLVK